MSDLAPPGAGAVGGFPFAASPKETPASGAPAAVPATTPPTPSGPGPSFLGTTAPSPTAAQSPLPATPQPPKAPASPAPASAQNLSTLFRTPAVVCIFGNAKMGKTTDTIYSFMRGLFIALPGTLTPALSVVGSVPQAVPAHTMDDLEKAIKTHVVGKAGQYDAVIVDDFSLIVTNTRDEMEKNPKFKDGRALYGALGRRVIDFLNLCRSLGIHVILNCHAKYPKDGEPGGPALPGALLQGVPKLCDMVLRVDHDPVRRPWPAVYRAGLWAGSDWITGDRWNVVVDKAPMNLGEILRAAGFKVSRAPGMEWAEDLVENATMAVLGGGQLPSVVKDVATLLRAQNVPDSQVGWVLRDLKDRVELRRIKSNALAFGFNI